MNLYFLIELGKVRCISFLVKSPKQCKFVKTDAIKNCTFWKYRNNILSAFHADLFWFVQKSVHKQFFWATYFREGSNCLFCSVNKILPWIFAFIFQLCILKPAIMLLGRVSKAVFLLWRWMELHFRRYSQTAWQYSSKESLGNSAVCNIVGCTVRYLAMYMRQ
jgi:hypothetical protein